MANGGKIEEKLLALFDTLSREFHILNTSYQQLESDVKQLSNASQNINETKQLANQINSSMNSVKESTNRIENALKELVDYKNNILEIPSQISEAISKIKGKCDQFDESFFIAVKEKIPEVTDLKEDLKHVVKLSKLIAKPLGFAIIVITFALAVFSTVTAFWKMYGYYSGVNFEQKNTVKIEQLAKDIKEIKKSLGKGPATTNAAAGPLKPKP